MWVQGWRDLHVQVRPEALHVAPETLAFGRHAEEVNDKCPGLLLGVGLAAFILAVVILLKGLLDLLFLLGLSYDSANLVTRESV